MKLLVQQYLETHSFADLIKEHGVYPSFSKSGQKFSINYDMIEVKDEDPLSQECRGLILAKPDGSSMLSDDGKVQLDVSPGETQVIAYPMKRFFNYGQGCAAQIDWNDPDLTILEKLDGTLIITYYDPIKNAWCVATRSVPEADLLMDNQLFTFRTLFEKAVQETMGYSFDSLTADLNPDFTYCFELTTPYNRIVVNYPNNGITLLAVRNLLTHKELKFDHPAITRLVGVPIVRSYSFNSMTDLVSWVSTLNPMEHEGVVVRDGKFNRLKVKNAQYIAYNKVRDSLATSPRNMVELILAEKDDDVVSFLPEEIVKNLQKIKIGIQMAIRRHDDAYQMAKQAANMIAPDDKKTFAILITKSKDLWTAPLFNMFDNKSINMRDFIQKNRKEGTWGNSFLDKVLEIAKRCNE